MLLVLLLALACAQDDDRLARLRREVADLDHARWLAGAGANADEGERLVMRAIHQNAATLNFEGLDPMMEEMSLIQRREAAQRE